MNFDEKDNTIFKCMVKREIIKVYDKKNMLIKYFVLLVSFIIINLNPIKSKEMNQVIILVEIFMITIFFVLDIYFESAKYEKVSRIEEILSIAGIGKHKNYIVPLALIFVLGSISNVSFILLNNAIMIICNRGISYEFKDIIICICTLMCSLLVCYILVEKRLNSLKEERVIKILIYAISVVMVVLVRFIILH